MDPQIAWLAMLQALVDGDDELASEYADSLYNWLNQDGFAPKVLPDLGQTDDSRSSLNQLDRRITFFVCAIVRKDTYFPL